MSLTVASSPYSRLSALFHLNPCKVGLLGCALQMIAVIGVSPWSPVGFSREIGISLILIGWILQLVALDCQEPGLRIGIREAFHDFRNMMKHD
ncbi:MAG: hypothetical protein S4CHLAM2_11450 [Chlamydiales bacterium]|nr:hypothetical protein [Chlamydiales bacterium]